MILQMRRIKSKGIIRLLLYVIILHSLVFAVTLNAQNGNPPMQLQPADGSLGLPGIVSGSWIMSWSSVPGVAYYQWVNSNNHLCFYGCAGDTRTENTSDTNGVVYYIPNQEYVIGLSAQFLLMVIQRILLPYILFVLQRPILKIFHCLHFLQTQASQTKHFATCTPTHSSNFPSAEFLMAQQLFPCRR